MINIRISSLVISAALLVASPALAVSSKYQALSSELVSEAQAALDAKKLARADELANLALTANPSNAAAFIIKAQAQNGQGDVAQSLRLVTIGLEIEPDNMKGLGLQGDYALASGNLEQAEQTLKNIRTLCAEACPQADKLQGEIDEARRELQKDN